jgi:hypothetical protein
VGLERDPLNPVITIEEVFERKSSGSGLETEIMAVGIRHTVHLQKLTLTSLTSGGRSVGIVCSWTQATEFSFSLVFYSLSPWHGPHSQGDLHLLVPV